ncbi:hypothetical protein [Salipiger mucosus]|uniref:Uncharacterized protein n=1 Tax=Salipiger mucosus DSM 16094 TaxID=1123237 RepID=S9Q9B5_9RHOB|nr:hypothetical protein [Salipiger mucosus]EPX76203.1 hypothetical protein Salmuc_01987 [Salipiger mucosus DSM 16094]
MILLLAIVTVAWLATAAFAYNIAIQTLWRLAAPPLRRGPGAPVSSGAPGARMRALIEISGRLAAETELRVASAERRLRHAKRLRDVTICIAILLEAALAWAGWAPAGAAVAAAGMLAAGLLGMALARVEHFSDQVRRLREALDDHERDAWVWRREFEQSRAAQAEMPQPRQERAPA